MHTQPVCVQQPFRVAPLLMDRRRCRCLHGRHCQGSPRDAGRVRSGVGSLRPLPASRASNRLNHPHGTFSRRTPSHPSIGEHGCNSGVAARLDRSAVALLSFAHGIGLESLTDAGFFPDFVRGDPDLLNSTQLLLVSDSPTGVWQFCNWFFTPFV
jgi:hypothetical protein